MDNISAHINNKTILIISTVILFLFLSVIIILSFSSKPSNQNKTSSSSNQEQSNNQMSGGAGVNNSSNNLSNQPVKNSGPSISNQNNQNPIPAYQNNYVINFKQSAYAKYAHRVFPGQISAETKSTLSPFTISSLTYPDGHTIVTLHYHKTGYEDVNVTAQPGENVYYIKLPNYEDPGDTGLIVEGTDGNIVPQN